MLPYVSWALTMFEDHLLTRTVTSASLLIYSLLAWAKSATGSLKNAWIRPVQLPSVNSTNPVASPVAKTASSF